MIIADSEQEKYRTRISNRQTAVFADAAAGPNGAGADFNPHDLLCAGLAACLNITARMVLERKNIPYQHVAVKVSLDTDDASTSTFRLAIDIDADISDQEKQAIVNMVKNCPVRKTLAKKIAFEDL